MGTFFEQLIRFCKNKINKSFVVILVLITNFLYSQNSKIMKKEITYESFKKILKEKETNFLSWIDYDFKKRESLIYISFNDNDTIIETLNFNVPTLENIGEHVINEKSNIYIYYNTEDFLKSINENDLKILTDNPLFKYRSKMGNITTNKYFFLEDLFIKLNFKRPKSLLTIDLKKFNNSLKEYGYSKLYDDLYLHLILFCGEYLNEQNNFLGLWNIDSSHNSPLAYEPIYIDDKGVSSYFTINILLGRDLIKLKDKKNSKNELLFKIEKILEFSEQWKDTRQKIDLGDK